MQLATSGRSTPAPENCTTVLAIDPGRDKCGVAVVALNVGELNVVERCIIGPQEVADTAAQLISQHSITQVILGNSTTSQRMADTLRSALPEILLSLVDETGSTLEARALYWEAHPPRGWRRMVPRSLQEPPEPVDDFAAVVLAHRFFARES